MAYETLTKRMSRRVLSACPTCKGRTFFLGTIGLEHTTGSTSHHFDLVICKNCGDTRFFVNEHPAVDWVAARTQQHEFFEYTIPDAPEPDQQLR